MSRLQGHDALLQPAQRSLWRQGLTVYGVAQDSANVTRSFVRRSGINYPILIEGDDYPLSKSFDIFGTPAIYVIDQDGEIRYTTQGFMRDQVDEIGADGGKLIGVEPISDYRPKVKSMRFRGLFQVVQESISIDGGGQSQ